MVVDCSFDEDVAMRCRPCDMRAAWVMDVEGVGLKADVVMRKRSADKSCMQIESLGVADLFILYIVFLEPRTKDIILCDAVYYPSWSRRSMLFAVQCSVEAAGP